MQNELRQTDPYLTDDNTPTLTLVTGGQSIALPYHLVKSMELGEDAERIDLEFDEQTVAIRGKGLGKLWREIRAYRVREVTVNGGAAAKAGGAATGNTVVETIEIVGKNNGTVSE